MGKANQQRRRMKEKERKRKPPTSSGGGFWLPGDQQTIEERAALDVSAALRALAHDDRGAFEAASARVADRSGATGWRRTTERLLAYYLQSAISGAWHRGCQPADLVPVVTRPLRNRHVILPRPELAAQRQPLSTQTTHTR